MQVRCQLNTENGFSHQFLSNMGVKKGYPSSPTLFSLCIDKLDEVVNKVAREEGSDVPKLMPQVIFLLLYVHCG